MWLRDPDARLRADRAYLKDCAGWVSTVRRAEAQVLLAAMRGSDDRRAKMALSARLLQARTAALLSLGSLLLAVRDRLASSLVQARLTASIDDIRVLYRDAQQLATRPCWEFLNLPSPDQVREAVADPAVASQFVEACEQRRTALRRVAVQARQDMLLSALDATRGSRLLVASGRTVSAIKTGQDSDLPETSNTAFFLADLSHGTIMSAGDLVAVACPTTPAVVEEIAADVAAIDQEASDVALLVDLVAEAGLLQTSYRAAARGG